MARVVIPKLWKSQCRGSRHGNGRKKQISVSGGSGHKHSRYGGEVGGGAVYIFGTGSVCTLIVAIAILSIGITERHTSNVW